MQQCRGVLERQWPNAEAAAHDLHGLWTAAHPGEPLPHLLQLLTGTVLEARDRDLLAVLAATLSGEPAEDAYWLELLGADTAQLAAVAAEQRLLDRLLHVQALELCRSAERRSWRGLQVRVLNTQLDAEQRRRVGRQLARDCDLAVVWHRASAGCTLHLFARRVDCAALAAALGRCVASDKHSAVLLCSEPFFFATAPRLAPWHWAALALVGWFVYRLA